MSWRQTSRLTVLPVRLNGIYRKARYTTEAAGQAEVTAFLNLPAIQRRVSASPKNQALAVLLFLYKGLQGTNHPARHRTRA